jgi:hypothetical protein
VARFGHAGAANARQAKSKQKLLDKKLAGGLTEKPVEDVGLKFRFPEPSYLPPPVLQVSGRSSSSRSFFLSFFLSLFSPRPGSSTSFRSNSSARVLCFR